MGNLEPFYIGINHNKEMVIQQGSYIEDGLYIRELLSGGFEIMSIPTFGGEEASEGVYLTLKEAFENLQRMKKEYT